MLKLKGRPYQTTRLVKYLQCRILELKPLKTQTAIAEEAGFVSVNMLSMVKRGSTKLPLDRVFGLAKALDCDAAMLFRMGLEQIVASGRFDPASHARRHWDCPGFVDTEIAFA